MKLVTAEAEIVIRATRFDEVHNLIRAVETRENEITNPFDGNFKCNLPFIERKKVCLSIDKNKTITYYIKQNVDQKHRTVTISQ